MLVAGGASLVYFLKLGFRPSNLYGIDILEERILEAQKKFPGINFVWGDAANMKVFKDNTFDIVFESTMFVQITDDQLLPKIASEMLRVAKPYGYIILSDWRYSKPGDARYKALSRSRISLLFEVGSRSRIIRVYRGALIPPVGRFLSKKMPFMYFVVSALFPFLVGQVTTVLKKF